MSIYIDNETKKHIILEYYKTLTISNKGINVDFEAIAYCIRLESVDRCEAASA